MATIDMPSALSQRVLNALKADPRTVDLRQQAPHFFSLAARMLDLFEEDAMIDVLSEVCYPPSSLPKMCWCINNLTMTRASESVPPRLLTMRITQEVRWEKGQNSCEGLTRLKDSVSSH